MKTYDEMIKFTMIENEILEAENKSLEEKLKELSHKINIIKELKKKNDELKKNNNELKKQIEFHEQIEFSDKNKNKPHIQNFDINLIYNGYHMNPAFTNM